MTKLKKMKNPTRIVRKRCPTCSGRGWYIDGIYEVDMLCTRCGGSGTANVKEELINDKWQDVDCSCREFLIGMFCILALIGGLLLIFALLLNSGR